jgi:hypothetical protein
MIDTDRAQLAQPPWHAQPIQEVASQLGVDCRTGLSIGHRHKPYLQPRRCALVIGFVGRREHPGN